MEVIVKEEEVKIDSLLTTSRMVDPAAYDGKHGSIDVNPPHWKLGLAGLPMTSYWLASASL